jgi:chromosome segregation ATPase
MVQTADARSSDPTEDTALAQLATHRILPFIHQYGRMRAKQEADPLRARIHQLQQQLAETQQQLAATQQQLAQALDEHAQAAETAVRQIAELNAQLAESRGRGQEQVAKVTAELMARMAAMDQAAD